MTEQKHLPLGALLQIGGELTFILFSCSHSLKCPSRLYSLPSSSAMFSRRLDDSHAQDIVGPAVFLALHVGDLGYLLQSA